MNLAALLYLSFYFTLAIVINIFRSPYSPRVMFATLILSVVGILSAVQLAS